MSAGIHVLEELKVLVNVQKFVSLATAIGLAAGESDFLIPC